MNSTYKHVLYQLSKLASNRCETGTVKLTDKANNFLPNINTWNTTLICSTCSELTSKSTRTRGAFRTQSLVNSKPPAIFAKCFTFNVWQGSNTPLRTKAVQVNIYLFKLNKRNTWKRCEICSKLKIKTPERRQYLEIDKFRRKMLLLLLSCYLCVCDIVLMRDASSPLSPTTTSFIDGGGGFLKIAGFTCRKMVLICILFSDRLVTFVWG